MNIGQMRHDKVQEMSAPATPRSRQGGFTLPPRWLLWGLGYALLLLLPFFFGLRPVSEYLGMTAQTDKYSRIGFEWSNPDQDARVRQIEQNNFPIYEEVPRGIWMAQVFNPISMLLVKAADLQDAGQLLKYAQEQKIELTAAEAKILTDYIMKELSSSLYAEVLSPAQRTLDQWVYTRGVIAQDRLELERKEGTRFIEVADPDNRVHRGRTLELQQENAPVGLDQAAVLVDKAFIDRLWLLKSSVRQTLTSLISRRLVPTLNYSPSLSTETFARRKEQAIFRSSHIGADEVLIQKGERVTPEVLTKLRAENEAYVRSLGPLRLTGELVGKTVLGVALVLLFIFPAQYIRRPQSVAATGLVTLPVMGLAYLFMVGGVPLSLLPVGFLVGCAALGGGGLVGSLAGGIFCAFLYSCCAQQPGMILMIVVPSITFSVLAPRQRFRMGLARAALISGLAGALTLLCWRLSVGEEIVLPRRVMDFLSLQGWENPLVQSVWIIFSWLGSFILLLLFMPFLQRLYGVTTNIRLQDLQEHPLLSKLLLEAPSTYYHSSVVSALAEAAGQAAGCNALLCKTACLYHDIGKLIKPEYFTENESGISRHDALTPQMSALIIISHVKDGVEMARQWGLPKAVVDIVSQHHGTTLVSFFLRQAREQAEDPDSVDEELFRYPGPRPQFKEAAVCMIADSVEAASRSLDDAKPARVRSLVHAIVLGKLEDRQFDESGLNFTDLAHIEEALVRILLSMFHSRVKYDNVGKARRR